MRMITFGGTGSNQCLYSSRIRLFLYFGLHSIPSSVKDYIVTPTVLRFPDSIQSD